MSDEIFWPAGPIFGSEVVVSQNLIWIGLQGTLYDPLKCWETVVRPLKIQISSLEIYGLTSAFLVFMALGVKFLQSPEFFCQNSPHKAKNDKISINGAVALAMAFEFFFCLFSFFLRSFIHEKSNCMQKSCMWVVFPPILKPSQNFHPGS